MDRSADDGMNDGMTRARVAEGALRQAARHERALHACLAELHGNGAPAGPLTVAMVHRARRHADRAHGLARIAVRLNRDPLAAPSLAAALERHDRNLMLVAERGAADTAPAEAA
jgi:hypothetical protein